MPHNISQNVLRQQVLAGFASNFDRWFLAVECPTAACPTGRHYRVAEILRGRSEDLTVGDLVTGLRCSGCRKTPTRVALVQYVPARSTGRRVLLVGPGAFG